MGPFVLRSQIDLGKIPYVREVMYLGRFRLYMTENEGLKFHRDVVVFFSETFQGD